MIQYAELPPHHAHTDFIKTFWQFRNFTEQTQQYTILPDGYFDLIIKLNSERIESTTLYGIWTKQVEVALAPDTTIWGIALKPLAAEYILRHSIAHLLNNFAETESSLWGLDSLPLADFTHFVEQFSEHISQTLHTHNGRIDTRKIALFELLFRSRGGLRVEEISEQLAWSSRQIHRYFNAMFGISLKAYSSILRCASSYKDISNGELFPQQDYYDQSHFIKEIKKHTGHIPKELHRNDNDRFLQFSTMR
jgi:AraC-like DNA-binding protein